MNERDEFEAWCDERAYVRLEVMWEAWKAARAPQAVPALTDEQIVEMAEPFWLKDAQKPGEFFDATKFARDILAARAPQAAPAGWQLVPIYPTKEMREAGAKIGNQGWDFAHHTWRTMLLHAPASTGSSTGCPCPVSCDAIRQCYGSCKRPTNKGDA